MVSLLHVEHEIQSMWQEFAPGTRQEDLCSLKKNNCFGSSQSEKSFMDLKFKNQSIRTAQARLNRQVHIYTFRVPKTISDISDEKLQIIHNTVLKKQKAK